MAALNRTSDSHISRHRLVSLLSGRSHRPLLARRLALRAPCPLGLNRVLLDQPEPAPPSRYVRGLQLRSWTVRPSPGNYRR